MGHIGLNYKIGDRIPEMAIEKIASELAGALILELFATSIEVALYNSIEKKMPVILIFEKDIACSVGNVIRRETRLKTNLLPLDELTLKDEDRINISEPLVGCQVFPVTVKSLIFNMN